jgi:hypothetical protein
LSQTKFKLNIPAFVKLPQLIFMAMLYNEDAVVKKQQASQDLKVETPEM